MHIYIHVYMCVIHMCTQSVEASVYLDDWNDGNYKFDSNQTPINHIKNTTKEDLVILMNEIFLQGQFMNTTVQIRGEDFKDTPFFNW